MGETRIINGDADAEGHVEGVVRRSGTSFFWAMRRLPAEKRRAMFAVYAFCREVDDIADEPGEVAGKRQQLADWRAETAALFEGRPVTPTGRALLGPVRVFGLKRDDFLAVIAGMETDAAPAVRLATMDDLMLYCDRVACAVGRLSNKVFGAPAELSDAIAEQLGTALQLTNILRDLAEDAARDRLYLPRDLLARHGIEALQPGDVLADEALAGACGELAKRAHACFDEAHRLLARCDRRAMRPAIMMAEVYRRTLDALMVRGWRRLDQAVGPSRLGKLWLALRFGVF